MEVKVTNILTGETTTYKDSKLMVAPNGTIFVKSNNGQTMFATSAPNFVCEV